MLDSIKNAVAGAVEKPLLLAAEAEIKKHTGKDIDLETEDIPADWQNWINTCGLNSIVNKWTWDFLENSEYNQHKLALWKERDIKKIVLTVKTKLDDDEDDWITCMPEWQSGSTTLKLVFYPRAGRWTSSGNWMSGCYSYWILADEIVFGLRLYQLPGKCFYKSDWLENFEDVDPDGFLPSSTKKFKRWFQFRHWIIYWYPEAQWGYNWQYTQTPPPLPDGSPFSLDSILKLPSLPDLKMPSIKLPSLPNVSMPSLPDMPSISAPSLSMPSLSAPSLSAPSLGSLPSLPSIPEKPRRPKGKWSCHGFIELTDMRVAAKGSEVILSNAAISHFWLDKNDYIDIEKKEHQRLVLKASDSTQAESWKLSLMESGVEEGDIGGCCTVA